MMLTFVAFERSSFEKSKGKERHGICGIAGCGTRERGIRCHSRGVNGVLKTSLRQHRADEICCHFEIVRLCVCVLCVCVWGGGGGGG
jgi:hypothetical protein